MQGGRPHATWQDIQVSFQFEMAGKAVMRALITSATERYFVACAETIDKDPTSNSFF